MFHFQITYSHEIRMIVTNIKREECYSCEFYVSLLKNYMHMK